MGTCIYYTYVRMIKHFKSDYLLKMHVFLIHLLFARFFNMADDGEEFVVDKILDKRVRNGKVAYKQLHLFTASSNSISG